MTDKELKKLSRSELLELLLRQSEENEVLTAQLAEANEKLNNRQIIIDDAGSIAEASLKLSGIFEAAQSAADRYLENVKSIESRSRDILTRREQECALECERRVKETEEACCQMEDEARRKCNAIVENIKKDMQGHWAELGRKIDLFSMGQDVAEPPNDDMDKRMSDE